MSDILLRISPPVTNEQLNALFAAAWEQHQARDFQPILRHSLLYVCAYQGETLVGFVNVAWDGGIHAFLLDTTVHHLARRSGIGLQLVRAALDEAQRRGMEWMHVDFEPHLRTFYQRCGFQPTDAGLVNLQNNK